MKAVAEREEERGKKESVFLQCKKCKVATGGQQGMDDWAREGS